MCQLAPKFQNFGAIWQGVARQCNKAPPRLSVPLPRTGSSPSPQPPAFFSSSFYKKKAAGRALRRRRSPPEMESCMCAIRAPSVATVREIVHRKRCYGVMSWTAPRPSLPLPRRPPCRGRRGLHWRAAI